MSYKEDAVCFIDNMEYKNPPYSSRNWGHSWHSLCSYHGKLKPAIAHFLIKNFTKEGDVVLDPLSGVGTIPLEACLQGRKGVGNDLSMMAYYVTNAKLSCPCAEDVFLRIDELENYIEINKNSNVDYSTAKFGLNGKIEDYFHPDTLKEILILRQYFINKKHKDDIDTMVMACFLHVLHGNRPYALSRRSHPLTPYAPKGEYIYKNVIEHIRNKAKLSYNKKDYYKWTKGLALNMNFEDLNTEMLGGKVDAIITSPPFTNSFKFYTQNWMRLWLTGWEAENFKNVDKSFLEIEQKNDMDIYITFFEVCNQLLKDNGKVILHLGKSQKCDMRKELSSRAEKYFNVIYFGEEFAGDIEKHGIKDKGGTTEHQFLFLEKK